MEKEHKHFQSTARQHIKETKGRIQTINQSKTNKLNNQQRVNP